MAFVGFRIAIAELVGAMKVDGDGSEAIEGEEAAWGSAVEVINVWSGPRSCSTSLMYSFAQVLATAIFCFTVHFLFYIISVWLDCALSDENDIWMVATISTRLCRFCCVQFGIIVIFLALVGFFISKSIRFAMKPHGCANNGEFHVLHFAWS